MELFFSRERWWRCEGQAAGAKVAGSEVAVPERHERIVVLVVFGSDVVVFGCGMARFAAVLTYTRVS